MTEFFHTTKKELIRYLKFEDMIKAHKAEV